MGLYLELKSKYVKADELVLKHDATSLYSAPKSIADVPADCFLICVVLNPAFAAAAIIFDDRELRDFRDDVSDHRPRRWLVMNKERAIDLAGRDHAVAFLKSEQGRQQTY